ncbi:MAG: dihydroxyacetone kinase subunit L [Chloroflexi bacterium]|nr:dihydroxyacetone kinase subunit L [Chloroflexota bacterium]
MNWAEVLGAVEAMYAQKRDELNALDAALGDGDHGTALHTAFKEIAARAPELAQARPAEILKAAALTLMNRMGGSSGALYGTLFLRASVEVKDLDRLTGEDMARMWEAGLEGVMQRGGAQVGDKTMVDALAPAVIAFRDSISQGRPAAEAYEAAAAAARFGAVKTSELVAKHGRAKFVGQRALGQIDAGAASTALLFEALRNYWREKGG